MKNIKNYKMSEINWKENFKAAKLYFTNKKFGCKCGCSGKYVEIDLNEVFKWLGNKDVRIFSGNDAFMADYRINIGKGKYNGNEITIRYGKNDNWKDIELIIELNNKVENCLN